MRSRSFGEGKLLMRTRGTRSLILLVMTSMIVVGSAGTAWAPKYKLIQTINGECILDKDDTRTPMTGHFEFQGFANGPRGRLMAEGDLLVSCDIDGRWREVPEQQVSVLLEVEQADCGQLVALMQSTTTEDGIGITFGEARLHFAPDGSAGQRARMCRAAALYDRLEGRSAKALNGLLWEMQI